MNGEAKSDRIKVTIHTVKEPNLPQDLPDSGLFDQSDDPHVLAERHEQMMRNMATDEIRSSI